MASTRISTYNPSRTSPRWSLFIWAGTPECFNLQILRRQGRPVPRANGFGRWVSWWSRSRNNNPSPALLGLE